MRIIFLGTNGWYTTPTGNTPCILIDSKTQYVIFDAGNGIYKLDEYIKENKPIALFISHFHIDHVSGLHTLAKFSFPQGIDVYVAKGRRKDFDRLVHPPNTVGYKYSKENIINLSTDIRVHELSEGQNDLQFPVKMFKMYHAYGNHGYRISLDDKIIAYSGDTKIGPNSFHLVQKADVLIHECAYKEEKITDWGHVNPTQAADLAKKAHVKQLVLTHFDASLYTDIKQRKDAENEAKKIFSQTIAATDDMILTL